MSEKNTHTRLEPSGGVLTNYKTLFLAALGGALEIYDFIIFVFCQGDQSSLLSC